MYVQGTCIHSNNLQHITTYIFVVMYTTIIYTSFNNVHYYSSFLITGGYMFNFRSTVLLMATKYLVSFKSKSSATISSVLVVLFITLLHSPQLVPV